MSLLPFLGFMSVTVPVILREQTIFFLYYLYTINMLYIYLKRNFFFCIKLWSLIWAFDLSRCNEIILQEPDFLNFVHFWDNLIEKWVHPLQTLAILIWFIYSGYLNLIWNENFPNHNANVYSVYHNKIQHKTRSPKFAHDL